MVALAHFITPHMFSRSSPYLMVSLNGTLSHRTPVCSLAPLLNCFVQVHVTEGTLITALIDVKAVYARRDAVIPRMALLVLSMTTAILV